MSQIKTWLGRENPIRYGYASMGMQRLCRKNKGAIMKIELGFPPKELFPNRASGTAWGKLYQTKSDYRQNSGWLAKPQLKGWTPPEGDIYLKLTFVMPDKRLRDLDNCLAASKAGLDGLADALGVNDKAFHPIQIARKQGDKKTAKIIVEIGE